MINKSRQFGRYFEEFKEGQIIKHEIRKTITEIFWIQLL